MPNTHELAALLAHYVTLAGADFKWTNVTRVTVD